MALKTLETPYTHNELVEDINDNFAELDTNKADTSALDNYIPLSQKGAPLGVPTLDAAGKVVQEALTAGEAKDYNTTGGGIKTKFDGIDSALSGITNGSVVVGKATALVPPEPPADDKDLYYGTSSSGTVGWYKIKQDEEGEISTIDEEPFTDSDVRWSTLVNGVYTLTIPHNGKRFLGAYRLNSPMYERVEVDDLRDSTNILIVAKAKFTGYVQLGK